MLFWIYSVIFVLFTVKAFGSQTRIQNVTSTTILENGNISFICYYSGGTNVTFVHWGKANKTSSFVYSPILVITCRPEHGFLENESLYEVECLENGTISLLLKHVSGERNGEQWKCRFDFETSNKSISIEVKVPVKTAKITYESDVATMRENASLTLECKTSPSRPVSDVYWFLRHSNSLEEIKNVTNQSIIINKVENDGTSDLTSSISYLTYHPDRFVNGLMLYCSSSNLQGYDVTSENITLNVTYPPDGAPDILGFKNGSVYDIIENDKGHLTCNVVGGNPHPTLAWTCFNDSSYVVSPETLVFDVKERNLTWTADRGQTSCSCLSEQLFISQTTTVNLNVQYPPDEPVLTVNGKTVNATVLIIRNNPLTVTCESESEPVSNFTWTGSGIVRTSNKTLHISNIAQNGTYMCNVSNMMTDSCGDKKQGTINRSIEVLVLFPPSLPVFMYNDSILQLVPNNSLIVVKGDTFSLICVSSGKPAPGYKWGNSTSDVLTFTTVASSFNETCRATNLMKETNGESREGEASSEISVVVLHPPDVPFIQLSNDVVDEKQVTGNVTVKEGDTINLTCLSKSELNPQYTWYINGNEDKKAETLRIEHVQRSKNGSYACSVSVVMKRTFGRQENASNKTETFIDVLFPDRIGSLKNRNITEGSFLDITCPISAGNPSDSEVYWTRDGQGLWNRSKSVLRLPNITRHDDGIYTCNLYNKFDPSIGNTSSQTWSTYFHLNVFFGGNVKTFYVKGQGNSSTVIINQTEKVVFVCDSEGNPAPHVNIKLRQRDIPGVITDKQSLTYTLKSASCDDAGGYICYAKNDFTLGQPKITELTLIVKCPPSLYSSLPDDGKVFIREWGTTVTLQITAKDYLDEHNNTIFYWYDNKNISIQRADSMKIVTTRGLQSNLTIKNVTREDLGIYQLRITNSVGKHTQTFELQAKETTTDPIYAKQPESAAVIAGSIAGIVVIIIGIAAGIWLYRKRRSERPTKNVYQNVLVTRNQQQRRKVAVRDDKVFETEFGNLQEVDDSPQTYTEPTEYYNTPEKIRKINVSELFDYVSGKRIDAFNDDFQKLPTALQKPCTFARRPENIALNRYNGIFPYDHSRVKINGRPDFFINACYIDGYKRRNAYIASLGPTAITTDTFKTFWQMVWYEESDIIVMLTNLNEPSGMKCERYWPELGVETFGDIHVSCQSTAVYAEYTVRCFKISKGKEYRILNHLHYTAWPDKKVPEDVGSLIDFRQRIKATSTTANGPVIVHCSAGIGRTGTLIALDRLIEEGQCEGSVNVFECVSSMREQRVKMVQTLEQYVYINKALVNVLAFDCDPIPIESFRDYVDTTNNNTYSRKFQQLQQSVETDNEDVTVERSRNKKLTNKNRHGADIPGDQNRVHLYLNRAIEDTNYINAVYINSFRRKDYFIMAQSPLPSTVLDFICMIYQEDCSCVVTLEDLKEPGMEVGNYLPAEQQTLNIGCFTVSCSRHDTKPHFIIRKMKIKNNEKFAQGEKVVYHFQYNKWITGNDTPGNAKEFLELVKDVEEYATQLGEDTSHVLVHCLKANQRSGIFCAVTIIIEKLKIERQVSVLNTLRHLRSRRQSAITSMEQMKFCYEAASTYCSLYNK